MKKKNLLILQNQIFIFSIQKICAADFTPMIFWISHITLHKLSLSLKKSQFLPKNTVVLTFLCRDRDHPVTVLFGYFLLELTIKPSKCTLMAFFFTNFQRKKEIFVLSFIWASRLFICFTSPRNGKYVA